jgi:thioredoxin-related protein
MKYTLLFITAILSLSACKKDKFSTVALPSEYIDNDWEAAKIESARTNKPILIDFYASWCQLCTDMKEETFKDPTVFEYHKNNYVTVFIDVEKGVGIQLGKDYNAKHLNQVILNKDLSLRAKRAGKVPPDFFLKWLTDNE